MGKVGSFIPEGQAFCRFHGLGLRCVEPCPGTHTHRLSVAEGALSVLSEAAEGWGLEEVIEEPSQEGNRTQQGQGAGPEVWTGLSSLSWG